MGIFTLRSQKRKALAKDCLSHRLYVKGWILRSRLLAIAEGRSTNALVVAYDDLEPVGVIVVRHRLPAFYVAPMHRRRGIAEALLKQVESLYRYKRANLWAIRGIKGSEGFFNRMDIRLVSYYGYDDDSPDYIPSPRP